MLDRDRCPCYSTSLGDHTTNHYLKMYAHNPSLTVLPLCLDTPAKFFHNYRWITIIFGW